MEEYLGKLTNRGRKAVGRALTELEAGGLIVRTRCYRSEDGAQAPDRIDVGPAARRAQRPVCRINEVGEHLDAWRLRKRYAAALKAAGLRAVRFHDLRHCFGSVAVRAFPLSDGRRLCFPRVPRQNGTSLPPKMGPGTLATPRRPA